MSGHSGDFEAVTAPPCAEAAAVASVCFKCLRGRQPGSGRWGLLPPTPRPLSLAHPPPPSLRRLDLSFLAFDKHTSGPYYVPGSGTQPGKARWPRSSLSSTQNKNKLEQGLPLVSEVGENGWPQLWGGGGDLEGVKEMRNIRSQLRGAVEGLCKGPGAEGGGHSS